MGLYPVISKPSRITSHSATLIDNIFTNNTEDNSIFSGLLMNDKTDHLPVFVMFDCEGQTKRDTMTTYRSSRRLRTDDAIDIFKCELAMEKWRDVYEAGNVDVSLINSWNCSIRAARFRNIGRIENQRLHTSLGFQKEF